MSRTESLDTSRTSVSVPPAEKRRRSTLARAAGLASLGVLLAPVAAARQDLFLPLHDNVFPADQARNQSVAAGDVDGDGDQDLLFSSGGAGALTLLYLNEGGGTFVPAPGQVPSDFKVSNDAELVDLDGDGDLDAVLANIGPDQVLGNDGSGNFDYVPGALPGVFRAGFDVEVADLDGDGTPDVYAAAGLGFGAPSSSDLLYLNQGGGIFAVAPLPGPDVDSRAVSFGDVDADGDLDVFVGVVGVDRLLLNDGAATFTDASLDLPPLLDSTGAAAFGDVDGDADLDLFLGNFGSIGTIQNRLYLNDGTGAFSDATARIPVDASRTTSVQLVDFDQDGDLDVLLGNREAANALYRNDGTGTFTAAPAGQYPSVPTETREALAVDLDADGDLDVIEANDLESNRLFLADPAHGLTDVTTIERLPVREGLLGDLALGDVDGDGDLDLLAGFTRKNIFVPPEPNQLLLNDGSGRFTDASAQLPPDLDATEAVALGDVDGDGDLDAVLGNWNALGSGTPNRLHLNDGAGVFTDAPGQLPLVQLNTSALALADFDADGDLDLFLGVVQGAAELLWLNDGLGTFTDASDRLPPPPSQTTRSVRSGDIDGDGDLDVIVVNDQSGLASRVLLNDGAATFTLGPPLSGGEDAVLVDLDGDGDLDLVLAGRDEVDRQYANDGAGNFSLVASGVLGGLPVRRLVVVDAGRDGDADVLAGTETLEFLFPGQDFLLENVDGAGTLASGVYPAEPTNTVALVVGDLDGDGDDDVIAGGFEGRSRLFLAVHRQLAWRHPPRVGKLLVLDLYGTPGGPWFLLLAPLPGAVPLPPFGTLRLDPFTTSLLASGFLDGQGRTGFAFVLPADPSLVGVDYFWQGLLGDPVLFSNLEITTFEAF